MLGSNHEMPEAFRAHFRDRFPHCPELPVKEFRSYLAEFPCLQAVETTSSKGLVTECEVRDALKQVSLSIGRDKMVYRTKCT